MFYFKNYIVFILFVMLFGVHTDLSSQVTKEKYPNISGYWKIPKGNILHIYQVGNVVYFTNRINQFLFVHKGSFIDSKTIVTKCKSIENSSRVTKDFNGRLSILNSKELLWEWDTGSQKFEFVTSD
jgi:hypothetical protein